MGSAVFDQSSNGFARPATTIDVVAQRNGDTFPVTECFNVAIYLVDDAIEQVGTAVNIADDIQAHIVHGNFESVR